MSDAAILRLWRHGSNVCWQQRNWWKWSFPKTKFSRNSIRSPPRSDRLLWLVSRGPVISVKINPNMTAQELYDTKFGQREKTNKAKAKAAQKRTREMS